MRKLRALWMRLRGLFIARRVDSEFDAELQSHMALAIEEGKRRGLSEAEARRQALLRAVGVVFRVWGTAYLGPTTVNSLQMQAGAVMADGPYRLVRNPLYLGLWCMVAAMAFLMPLTGALVALAMLTVFLFRPILGEEAFLAPRLGEPYQNYLRAVPRLIPRFRNPLPSAGAQPHWPRAALVEITSVGVFVALAVFSWTYDNRLMVRVILIGFGVSLIARALTPGLLVSSNQLD